jgi:hypothetical protein
MAGRDYGVVSDSTSRSLWPATQKEAFGDPPNALVPRKRWYIEKLVERRRRGKL